MRFPTDLKYTQEHEWARIEGDIATVGITDHAQGSLGDVVYVDLPQVGRELKKGETFGVVESIKAVSDLYAPFTGKVIEVNSALTGDPSTINRSPHESWMIKLKATSLASESSGMMDAATYEAFVKKQ